MRNFFVILLVMASFVVKAQTVITQAPASPAKSTKSAKPFKVKLAGGYVSPANGMGESDFVKGGLAYSIEPQYELTRSLEVGLRFEQAFIKRPEALSKDIFYATKAKSILSGALTANYVFNTGTGLKPFIGVGVGGYYTEASQQNIPIQGTSSTVAYPLPATVSLGGLARIGVKYGIVHVEADYNLISDTSVKNAATGLTLTAQNTYFGIKAGLTIGGSR
ncbi:outer membrane beta-barrel protein [Spirosoma aerophilum]